MGFQADTPENDSNMPEVWDFRTKIWLKSNWRETKNLVARQYFFNQIFVWKSLKMDILFFFPGASASNPMQIWSVSDLACLNRQVLRIRHFLILLSHVILLPVQHDSKSFNNYCQPSHMKTYLNHKLTKKVQFLHSELYHCSQLSSMIAAPAIYLYFFYTLFRPEFFY